MREQVRAVRDEVAEALAAIGLYMDDGDAPQRPREWHLWPEHLPAFEAFLGLQTQWVVGMAGPVGLAYAGVEACLRLYGLTAAQRRQRFAELQHIERGWLAGWHEKNDSKKDRSS